jgi:hypothetical protein
MLKKQPRTQYIRVQNCSCSRAQISEARGLRKWDEHEQGGGYALRARQEMGARTSARATRAAGPRHTGLLLCGRQGRVAGLHPVVHALVHPRAGPRLRLCRAGPGDPPLPSARPRVLYGWGVDPSASRVPPRARQPAGLHCPMGTQIDPLVESVVRLQLQGRQRRVAAAIIAPWIASEPWRGESKAHGQHRGQGWLSGQAS